MGLGMRAIVRVRVYLKREAWGQFTANTVQSASGNYVTDSSSSLNMA